MTKLFSLRSPALGMNMVVDALLWSPTVVLIRKTFSMTLVIKLLRRNTLIGNKDRNPTKTKITPMLAIRVSSTSPLVYVVNVDNHKNATNCIGVL